VFELTYRKKLIEVALPLDAINREAAREKSIRHGHPSTLHLWWARRPLAACRAVLFSSLVDDPSSDPAYLKPDGSVDEDRAGVKRAQLFDLIEELVKWDNSNNDTVINAARAEIARCIASRKLETGELKKADKLPGGETVWDLIVKGHGDLAAIRTRHIRLPNPESVNAFLAEHAPPVLDPFCGGGSIPLEAQRLGLRAHASDLNPIPVLITKALIEIPPKCAGWPPVHPPEENEQSRAKGAWHGAEGLAEDVRHYGKWMCAEAERRIGHLYPKVEVSPTIAKDRPDLKPYVGQKLTAIAWLWARTMRCPNPACHARTPLVRSFWLSKRTGRETYAYPVLDAVAKTVRFDVRTTGQPPKHTTDAKGARCLFCDRFVRKPELREIACEHGVAAIPLAAVCEGEHGRIYLPTDDRSALTLPRPEATFLDQLLPNDKRWFSPPLYGLPHFSDLFTSRQLVALTTFSDLLMDVRHRARADALTMQKADPESYADSCSAADYADAIATYLAFGVDKNTLTNCTLATWQSDPDRLTQAMSRQAMPMSWDYAEANPLSSAGGGYVLTLDAIAEVMQRLFSAVAPGCVKQTDAATIASEASFVISTDPPYYDNIGYADLSDWFYLWLRRSISGIYPDLFRTVLTPKAEELIAVPYRHGGDKEAAMRFFETGLGRTFERIREAGTRDWPLTVYYAFKQAESEESSDDGSQLEMASTGWETMLEGLIRSGFTINGTWPIRTELIGNLKKQVNALATSVVLVCHPRPSDATMTTRKDFVAALKKELPAALRDLQSGNIAPVDLAQAAIGPGMAIYSRYSKVISSDGTRMPVRAALQLINQALDEVLSEQESEFDSETRWAIKWFEQHAHDEGPFGDAETLSKAMAVSVRGLREAGILKDGQGKVRLLRREELADDWDPTTDKRLTIWEVAQHLIRRLESDGETGAAELRRKVGSLGDVARDLAYRLYSLCERKKWADEARSYNGLVVSWPEIERLARELKPTETSHRQAKLFD
jgi:putative DNA methylase